MFTGSDSQGKDKMSMNPGMKEDAEKIRQRRKLVRIYGASPVFGVK